MDQLISIKDLYHILSHPLSVLIHRQYQDNDGCSRNGSSHIIQSHFRTYMVGGGGSMSPPPTYVLDHRGAIMCLDGFVDGLAEVVDLVGWKSCEVKNVEGLTSSSSISPQDYTTMTNINQKRRNALYGKGDDRVGGGEDLGVLENVTGFEVVGGEIIGFSALATNQRLSFVTPRIIDSLATFPNLRSLIVDTKFKESIRSLHPFPNLRFLTIHCRHFVPFSKEDRRKDRRYWKSKKKRKKKKLSKKQQLALQYSSNSSLSDEEEGEDGYPVAQVEYFPDLNHLTNLIKLSITFDNRSTLFAGIVWTYIFNNTSYKFDSKYR